MLVELYVFTQNKERRREKDNLTVKILKVDEGVFYALKKGKNVFANA